MKKTKIRTLNILFVIALLGAWLGTFLVKKIYHYPVEWLLHYLMGSGKDKKVPTKIVEEAAGAFISGIEKNDLGNESLGGEYAISHSTLYAGEGFHERHSLFYIIGCSLFNYNPRTGKVWGSDFYDWHSDPDADKYFTSPLGDGRAIKLACSIMGKLFGDDLFINERSDKSKLIMTDTSQAAISNKLWEVLCEAGAKGFTTVFEGHICVPKDTVIKAVRDHRRFGCEIAEARFERIVARSYNVDESKVCMIYWADNFCSMEVDGEVRYFNIDGYVITRSYGYDVALIKAAIHAAEFDQERFKISLLDKRYGGRSRRSRRSRRDDRRRRR